jgi:hypothetical protein
MRRADEPARMELRALLAETEEVIPVFLLRNGDLPRWRDHGIDF